MFLVNFRATMHFAAVIIAIAIVAVGLMMNMILIPFLASLVGGYCFHQGIIETLNKLHKISQIEKEDEE